MPYIPSAERTQLDAQIAQLAARIRQLSGGEQESPLFAGRLNYAITSLILQTIPARRYWAVATVTGVIHNVLDEFYRRYAAPYEDEQITKNGDVPEYVSDR